MSLYNNLSEENIEKIKDAFELVDSNGEGIFYPKEFKTNMEKMGLHEKEPFVYSIINELDTEEAEKNGISFDDFMKIIDNKLGNKNKIKEYLILIIHYLIKIIKSYFIPIL